MSVGLRTKWFWVRVQLQSVEFLYDKLTYLINLAPSRTILSNIASLKYLKHLSSASLCYTLLPGPILYYAIPYYTILYYTILSHSILYHTIPYYTILYYTILYLRYKRQKIMSWLSEVMSQGKYEQFYYPSSEDCCIQRIWQVFLKLIRNL